MPVRLRSCRDPELRSAHPGLPAATLAAAPRPSGPSAPTEPSARRPRPRAPHRAAPAVRRPPPAPRGGCPRRRRNRPAHVTRPPRRSRLAYVRADRRGSGRHPHRPVRLVADPVDLRARGGRRRAARRAAGRRGRRVWSEGRPAEGGRTQLVRRAPTGPPPTCCPRAATRARPSTSTAGARGGCATASCGSSTGPTSASTGSPPAASRSPLTPEPARRAATATPTVTSTPTARRLVCVRERHPGDTATDVVNEVVRLAAHAPSRAGGAGQRPGLRRGAAPAPGRATLAWLQWNHPDDAVGRRRAHGAQPRAPARRSSSRAGRGSRSPSRAGSPTASLSFLLRPHRLVEPVPLEAAARHQPVVRIDAEIGVPGWAFGTSRYAVLRRRAGGLRPPSRRLRRARRARAPTAPSPTWTCRSPRSAPCAADGRTRWWWSPAPDDRAGVYRVDPRHRAPSTTLRAPRDLRPRPGRHLGAGARSRSRRSTATAPAHRARAVLPAGQPATARGPTGELPPLLVVIHGGPTGGGGAGARASACSTGPAAASPSSTSTTAARPATAARTASSCTGSGASSTSPTASPRPAGSPAAAGSTRRGCASAAARRAASRRSPRWPATTPRSRPAPTTSASPTSRRSPRDTHKFESRYLDRLVGPYPEARDVYVERSPIHHVELLDRPLIVLQGARTRSCRPTRARRSSTRCASAASPSPTCCSTGEQHGFRRAENIRRALDAELCFYAQVLGFELPTAEGIEPVAIENL